MLRIEEAMHAQLGDRAPGDSGLNAGKGVASGRQGVGDRADLLGAADPGHRTLRGLVGVERHLVVDASLLVQFSAADLPIETLQLLAEDGVVLVGEAPDAFKLLMLGGARCDALSPLLRHKAPTADQSGEQNPLHRCPSTAQRLGRALRS